VRRALISHLRRRRGLDPLEPGPEVAEAAVDPYDQLAEVVRRNVDMAALLRLVGR
jgi:hypothetical protein